MTPRPLSAVVLAAGEGTRMMSARPKPLHRLCGRPMVLHVIDALAELHVDRVVVVVGHGADRVQKTVLEDAPEGVRIQFVEQSVQRGTGDAVSVGVTALPDADDEDGDVIVLPGDTPLLRPATIAALVRQHRAADAAATLLTARVGDPYGYGRVVRREDGRVTKIVEEVDATLDERDIDEINTSIYVFRHGVLAPGLRRVVPDNAKGELYLTDVIGVLYDAGYTITTLEAADSMEAAGVNDRAQLAVAEAELRDRTNERWMRRGVTMLDPEHTYVDAVVELGTDVTLFPGSVLQGRCVIGEHAEIGPNTRLIDCIVGDGAIVENSVGRQAEIGDHAVVGPFASLEPGARVAAGVATGAFYVGTAVD
ncbi:MAG TPA: NTP transferase domain-containing protein [Acidimicrobiales bacterium]|nr:NTP transferase domain-containing protein [Acidimicrobiales bacterium]